MAFRRKGNRKASTTLPGCRPSPSNGLPVVASGVPSLDNLLGGGLHVGSCIAVEEDEFGSYARILMNLFAAEGVVSGHSLYVASASVQPASILDHLPGLANSSTNTSAATATVQTSGATSDTTAGSTAMGSIREEEDDDTSADSLKIAWRYEKQATVANSSGTQPNRFSHTFDLGHKLDIPSSTTCGTFDGLVQPCSSKYTKLLQALDQFVEEHSLQAGSPNVLRLCLHCIGSPLWTECDDNDPLSSSGLLQFFHVLQARLRRWSAVALVTIPSHLWNGTPLAHRVRQLVDYAVHVESFAGSSKQQNPLYKDYHGLFHICKLPCWNSLAPIPLDSTDWAFKLRRKNFSIDKLHLPPDLSETASRTQEDPVKPNKAAAAPGGRGHGRSLDF
ncbi:elongator complex protein 4-like [Sycon ciliatum]|uniref:elongator complex protein 4-like n=1 Tax=Sycon ciliatum TaxID=27933 RepID=UPI0031F6A173